MIAQALREQQALQRAHEQHVAVAPLGTDLRRWVATSSRPDHDPYHVTVSLDGRRAICDCPAGQKSWTCKHGQAVLEAYEECIRQDAWDIAHGGPPVYAKPAEPLRSIEQLYC